MLITLLSIVILLIASVSFALWFVFTPSRISPVINNQAAKFFNCQMEIGEVEFTFFSTFPRLGLRVDNFRLINPFPGAQSDTLMNVDRLIGVFDVGAYLRHKEIILSDIILENGTINAYVDKAGKPNFDVLVTDTVEVDEPETEFRLGFLDTGVIEFRNINLRFIDDSLKIDSDIRNLYAQVMAKMDDDWIESHIQLERSDISFVHAGEHYLSNAEVRMVLPANFVPSLQSVSLDNASFSVNGLELKIHGTIINDNLNGNLISDIAYSFSRWPFSDLLELIPSSFLHHLDGMELDGIFTSEGTITGIYNDTVMPWLDIHFAMENGKLLYHEYPIPLSDLKGDVNIYTNLKDELSYVKINGFSGKTPESDFSTRGTVKNLFTDIHTELTTNANLLLNEFNPFIPDTLNASFSGRVRGQVTTDFTMSQLQAMDLDRMKISGHIAAANLDVALDSIWARTDRMQLAFALPNHQPSSASTRFAFANIGTGDFWAGTLDGHSAHLKNARITLEMSDVRDTTRLPDLICTFKMDTLSVGLDTIRLAVRMPQGNAALNPREQNAKNPEIKLVYFSEAINAQMGKDLITIKTLNLDAEILNDDSQADVFLQWLVKGFIDMEEGVVQSSSFTHRVEIPSIKMDFEPERLDIKDGRMTIDKSDFELSGLLINMLSYYRGDSILRGDFRFVSDNTDVSQLMNLTSGLGVEQEDAGGATESNTIETENINKEGSGEYSGPYIVPQGVDILLSTIIKHATFGVDTARDITGEVRVYDGILLLDDLKFTTPAARMQLTAMYRTPRKNHLFLGIDYHMFDIEIERLLQMIPDIDTLMPMLRSFRGKGEFHMAVETYLDSLYNVKKSTLRGASSIRGENLVLMDGETFSEIAQTLRFSRRAENIVDSLSAEFTIFREEIDIYPFLIVMDRYKAVIGGRHNFDLSFKYHISVVDSPIPLRFGIDVTGNLDDIKYSPTSARYAEFYRPASRRAVENRQLELRRMIREALTSRVLE